MRDNLPTRLRDAAKKWREKHKIVGVGEIRYDFALEEAADAIEELSREIDIDDAAMTAMDAAMPRWISVAERLPEANGYYLTYVESALFPNSYYFNMIKFIDGEFIEDHCVIHRVTHWMPLPKPPKEE